MGKAITYIKVLSHLCFLINRKSTGALRELSTKLGVSQRTVQRLIQHLKDEGVAIRFCKYNQSYVCNEGNVIECTFKIHKPIVKTQR